MKTHGRFPMGGRTVSCSTLRARGYTRTTGDHHVTPESRQLPELVRGVQASIMARFRKVKELGFEIDKDFHNAILQIAYNEEIDAALKAAGWSLK